MVQVFVVGTFELGVIVIVVVVLGVGSGFDVVVVGFTVQVPLHCGANTGLVPFP